MRFCLIAAFVIEKLFIEEFSNFKIISKNFTRPKIKLGNFFTCHNIIQGMVSLATVDKN